MIHKRKKEKEVMRVLKEKDKEQKNIKTMVTLIVKEPKKMDY